MEKFTNLKIIPIKKAILHEDCDLTRVDKIEKRFAKEKILLNPVIATKLKNGNYVILDGANRVTVFRKLKIPHLLVQIVPYKFPIVKLKTWNHLIIDKKFRKFYPKKLKTFNKNNLDKMSEFVNLYKDKFQFKRVTKNSIKSVCLVKFPKFSTADIINFAENNKKIPSGITRHIIQDRILRLRLPLKILSSKHSLAEKNQWLNKFINAKIESSQIRFYQESVYLFDE